MLTTLCYSLISNTRNNKQIYIHIYIYIVDKTREISENKVLNIVNVELLQLRLHLLLHVVTLCFTYADDDGNLQTGAEDRSQPSSEPV